MMRFILSLIVMMGGVNAAFAQPCVGPTFDAPLPDATDVRSHIADVRSALFPAFWQEGVIETYRYKIFSDRSGGLTAAGQDRTWDIGFTCSGADQACVIITAGTPPPDARAVVDRLTACVRGVDLPVKTVVAQAPLRPLCRPVILDADNDIVAVQRMIVLAGADPGPVDGAWGPRTIAALRIVLDLPTAQIDIADAKAALRARSCAG